MIVAVVLQSIPSDMEFDPNSNPPCYKTKEEVVCSSFFTVYDVEVDWLEHQNCDRKVTGSSHGHHFMTWEHVVHTFVLLVPAKSLSSTTI